MKVALIPPIPALEQFGRGEFHLLLSHLLHDKRYFAHYEEQRRRGAYLVLDNAAHEKGAGDDPEFLMFNAAALNVQEVVVPDVLEDGKATVDLAISSLETWYEGHLATLQDLDPTLMYVPQGKDKDDWVMCLAELIRIHKYIAQKVGLKRHFVIGVSKDYAVWEGGTQGLIRDWLVELREHQAREKRVQMQVHLLGWERNVWNLYNLQREFPWIRSTDSAKPFVYGMHGISLDPEDASPPYPGRPEDYFEREIPPEQMHRVNLNVEIFKRLATGQPIL